MSRYSVGVRTPAAGAAAAYCDIRTTSTKPVYVLEIGCFSSAATASGVGIGRPATLGTTSTTTLVQAEKSGDAAGVTVVGTAWSAAPTAPTIFMRRLTTPANTGAGFIFQWPPNSLLIPISGSLILSNFGAGAGAAMDVYVVVDE